MSDNLRERDVMAIIAGGADFLPGFRDWLLAHWLMWERFNDAADKVRERGITSYSAFVIVNVLRYRADLEGQKFSMTNTFVPDLARLYNKTVSPIFNVSTRKKREENHHESPPT